MTDRELLELAAKAAGVGPLDFDYAEREGHGFHMGPRLPMPQGVLMAAMWTYWNPLADDGDAMRLAGDVGLTVRSLVECNANGSNRRGRVEVGGIIENFEGGRQAQYAATRRAIVRAAAEIGRAA